MITMQRYPFAMAANGVMNIPCSGTRFVIVAASSQVQPGPIEVTLDIGSKLSGLLAGQGYKGVPFAGLSLRDLSGAANSGWILVSDDDYLDGRITGEVSTINGELLRTRAGKRMFGTAWCAADATHYATVYLNTPVGSANLVVTGLSVAASIACPVNVLPQGGQAPGLNSVNRLENALTVGGINLTSGSVYSDQTQAVPIVPAVASGSGLYKTLLVPASQTIPLPLSGPIIVHSGWALCLQAQLFGVSLYADFEWYEDTP